MNKDLGKVSYTGEPGTVSIHDRGFCASSVLSPPGVGNVPPFALIFVLLRCDTLSES